MSLTKEDFQEIRTIVRDEVRSAISTEMNPKLEKIEGELEALRNDIKELYDMISDLQGSSITDDDFKKLSLEEKLLTLNAELLATAKQAGVILPRQ